MYLAMIVISPLLLMAYLKSLMYRIILSRMLISNNGILNSYIREFDYDSLQSSLTYNTLDNFLYVFSWLYMGVGGRSILGWIYRYNQNLVYIEVVLEKVFNFKISLWYELGHLKTTVVWLFKNWYILYYIDFYLST